MDFLCTGLWDSRNLTIWTVVECLTGMIAGNLAALKPLFTTILKISGYSHGSRSGRSKPTRDGTGGNYSGQFAKETIGGRALGHLSSKHSSHYNTLSSAANSKGEVDDAYFTTANGKEIGIGIHDSDEAHMMTRITARSVGSQTSIDQVAHNGNDGQSDKISEDSIEIMAQGRIAGGRNKNSHNGNVAHLQSKLGEEAHGTPGITKTMTTSVEFERVQRVLNPKAVGMGLSTPNKLELAPERRVEDRV
jgi:hypothetical protein